MNWLKKKVLKWVHEDRMAPEEGYYDTRNVVASKGIGSGRSTPNKDPDFNFRIYSAVNGQILEFNHYDPKTDRSHNSVYLVDKDEDLGEYVKKCLTLENLR